mmetsp:Transcript_20415/g.65263  ORF Transcript_20415/g.65263 Transcript_20415/m.65263 type:complete len:209 (+) Transcript_20415:281-907(+)
MRTAGRRRRLDLLPPNARLVAARAARVPERIFAGAGRERVSAARAPDSNLLHDDARRRGRERRQPGGGANHPRPRDRRGRSATDAAHAQYCVGRAAASGGARLYPRRRRVCARRRLRRNARRLLDVEHPPSLPIFRVARRSERSARRDCLHTTGIRALGSPMPPPSLPPSSSSSARQWCSALCSRCCCRPQRSTRHTRPPLSRWSWTC